jgi:hypothetical protein
VATERLVADLALVGGEWQKEKFIGFEMRAGRYAGELGPGRPKSVQLGKAPFSAYFCTLKSNLT